MSDFYDLLKQSIIEHGIRGAKERTAVYAQARGAIVKQLRDYRPPLSKIEIEMRVGAFDAAVKRIEADVKQLFAGKDAFVPDRKRRRAVPAPVNGDDDTPPFEAWPVDEPNASLDSDHPSPYAPPPERPPGSDDVPPRAAPRLFSHDADEESDERDEARRDEEPDFAPFFVADEEDEHAPSFIYDEAEDEDDFHEEDAVEIAPARKQWFGRKRHDAEVEDEDDGHDESEPREDLLVRVSAWLTDVGNRLSDWFGTRVWARLSDWLGTGEQRRIRLLAVAVGGLFIVLVGFAAFILGSSHRVPEVATQTTPSGVEISDATTAAEIPNETLTVMATYTVFDGKNPSVFQSPPDNPVRFNSDGGFARVGTTASASGVKVAIGPGLASQLAGRRVRIVVTARSARDQGATGMRFAYQSGLALSYWQRANLGKDFTPVGMIWRLPAQRTSTGDDYILIQPGVPGDGTGADIKSIRIDVLAS